jgi:hypothetical protein
MREIICCPQNPDWIWHPHKRRGLFLRGTKQPERETDHPPPSSAEVKMVEQGNCIKLSEQMEYVHIGFRKKLLSLYQEPVAISRKRNWTLHWSTGNTQFPKHELLILKSDTDGGCLIQQLPRRTEQASHPSARSCHMSLPINPDSVRSRNIPSPVYQTH